MYAKILDCSNLYFTVRGQKALCDGHTDIISGHTGLHIRIFISKLRAKKFTMTNIWTFVYTGALHEMYILYFQDFL